MYRIRRTFPWVRICASIALDTSVAVKFALAVLSASAVGLPLTFPINPVACGLGGAAADHTIPALPRSLIWMRPKSCIYFRVTGFIVITYTFIIRLST